MTRPLPAALLGLTLGVAATVASAQSPSPIDTSGWKTYRNEAMGFEAKYPRAWHVNLASGTGPESVLLGGAAEPGKPKRTVQFWVQRRMNPRGLSIAQWYADQAQRIKAAPHPITNTLIGGRPAVRREIVGTLGRHVAFFTALNEADIFQITIIQPSDETRLDPTSETLLSTIKFLE